MDEEQHGGSMPGLMLPIGPILLIAIIVWIAKSRRKSKDDRAFSRIINAIEDTDLPDRVKDVLRERVDEARSAVSTVRELAVDLRGK